MNIEMIKAAMAARVDALGLNKPVPVIITETVVPSEPAIKSDSSENTTKNNTESDTTAPKKRTRKPREAKKTTEIAQPVEPVAITAENPSAETPVAVPEKKDIEEIIKENLVAGRDYNTIPGCGRKPTLLKSGAERLASIFGYTSTAEIVNRVELWNQSFISYEVRVTLYDSTGKVVSHGLGECNNRERKYIKSSFCDILNTIIKMAKKRAYVDAVLTATCASGVFTQDIEDLANPSETK